MDILKKHRLLVIIILALFVLGYVVVSHSRESRSLADFGIQPLVKTDCSSLTTTSANNSPITISLSAPDVSTMRDKVKALVIKRAGHITSDSFNSYPSPAPGTYSQDSASITATFDASQDVFLTELATVVKDSGGVNTSYNYTDANQPQNSSSTYSSCVSLLQNVSADVLQLEIFTKALKEEHNSADIALLSQSVISAKSTLQNDVTNANNFFTASDKPSVSISISALQH